MILDTYIDRAISEKLLADNQKERENHKSSGKLSAGSLGLPLQWQILKSYGVPEKPIDEYTLRKFARGKDVEDWVMKKTPDITETQKFVEYKGVIGYADALVDTANWDFPCGIIPLECKSITNAAFKWLKKDGAKKGHKLQNALYALALGVPKYAILYVASDDLRFHVSIHETVEMKQEIDGIIEEYNKWKASGRCPAFKETEKWTSMPDYQKYPDWAGLTEEEATEKLQNYLKQHG